MAEEHGGTQDQEEAVDDEGARELDIGIPGGEPDRVGYLVLVLPVEVAGLNDGGVEVEVVGHDRGADDTQCHGELPIAQNLRGGHESFEHGRQVGSRQDHLVDKDDHDDQDQRGHDGLDSAESDLGQEEQYQNIQNGQGHAQHQGDAEEEFEGDGPADHFGDVGGHDCKLGADPKDEAEFAAGMQTGRLGQIQAGHDAQLGRHVLEHHGDQAGDEDDAHEEVAVLGSATDGGDPVAGVHVAHGHQGAWAGEGGKVLPEGSGGLGYCHRGVDFLQGTAIGGLDDRVPPAWFIAGRIGLVGAVAGYGLYCLSCL